MKNARSRERANWTNMTMSDWMDMTPSDWMDRVLAGMDQSYGDYMSARPSDWWTRMYGGAAPGTPAERNPERRRRGPWEEEGHQRHKHHHHDSHCHRCGSDACECYCCIGDVDLAVYTHLGEQRVIQIAIENERHRDKQITVELSGWTTRGGSPAPVQTVFLEPKTFTLEACAEQQITLVVKIDRIQGDVTRGEAAATTPGEANRLPDVDDCLTAIADLRLVGCDHRPIRIAIAVLPRDCDPYRVDCGCACC